MLAPFDFLILSLAAGYISHVLANTDGVLGIFESLRTAFGKVIGCQHCNIFWIALMATGVYAITHDFDLPTFILVWVGAAGAGLALMAWSGVKHL